MTPLLLFSRERGTDTRWAWLSCFLLKLPCVRDVLSILLCFPRCAPGSSPASLQTSFLCELKRFLGAVVPQKHLTSPPLPLDSLHSLPPLTLGLSSSETLLAVIMNSTAPTVFAFSSRDSVFPVCHRELAMSPALLEELRHRLEETLGQMADIIREENVPQGAKQSLGRLKHLSTLQTDEHTTGGV